MGFFAKFEPLKLRYKAADLKKFKIFLVILSISFTQKKQLDEV